MYLIYASIGVGFLALLIVVCLALRIVRVNVDNQDMNRVSGYIKEATGAFIKRHYKTILIFMIAPLIPLILFNVYIALSFFAGALLSLLSAYISLRIAVEANVRTAYISMISPFRAFKLAFNGGAVVGLSTVSLSLIGIGLLYLLSALFTQLGGGIFTKAADIAADLVGKVEHRISEDDPRNPAVIADQVGDVVGDCAGRGSDLFESLSDDYVTAMILGSMFMGRFGVNALAFPLLLGASSILATLVGLSLINFSSRGKPALIFNLGLIVTAVFCVSGSFIVSTLILHDFNVFLSILSGLLASLAVGFVVQYYTGFGSRPVRRVADASKRGAAINILTGFSYALQGSFLPILMVASAFLFSYIVTNGSIYGILGANLGTDLAIGFIMSGDAFGPICDNAAGIAEMTGFRVFNRGLDELDALGNTTKAYTKAFASSSGVFSTLVIFMTYSEIVNFWDINFRVMSPIFVAGLLIGASLSFIFSSMVIGATSKTALELVDIIRNYFKENPDVLEGRVKPDYARCVDAATSLSLKRMIIPGFIAMLPPILIGFALGKYALGAMLLGGLSSSAILSPMFTFGGGLWDNSKKYIEKDFWMKGTPTHEAAVIGDTVGDPLKDVAGPSLNIFMKLMNMVALLIAPILLSL